MNTDVLSLINGDTLLILITTACDVARFNAADNCSSWSSILNPNGGDIASIGPTRTA